MEIDGESESFTYLRTHALLNKWLAKKLTSQPSRLRYSCAVEIRSLAFLKFGLHFSLTNPASNYVVSTVSPMTVSFQDSVSPFQCYQEVVQKYEK
jgi:hypothetical protein